MIFLCHNLDESLKNEYLIVKDPADLWANIKERYDHQKAVILPKARFDWLNLRLQDFKCINDYNSAMFKITSKLKLCGEKVTYDDMLEKTYTTFHASNILLQQQYHEKGFKKYSELISCLLVAEQNNELLMKNHETRPTGTNPFPEANVTSFNIGQNSNNGRGRGHGRGRGWGRGYGRGGSRQNYGFYNANHHQKLENFKNGLSEEEENDKTHHHKQKYFKDTHGERKSNDESCYRCGMDDHWSHTCRTPKHLVDLYQASIEGNNVEANFVNDDTTHDQYDDSHLDDSDIYANNEGTSDIC